MTKPKTVAELAAATADSIEAGGWTRGAFEQGGRMCAYGHARNVMSGSPYAMADPLVVRLNADFRSARGESLIEFNDAQPSKQRVIKALREFAESEAQA